MVYMAKISGTLATLPVIVTRLYPAHILSLLNHLDDVHSQRYTATVSEAAGMQSHANQWQSRTNLSIYECHSTTLTCH